MPKPRAHCAPSASRSVHLLSTRPSVCCASSAEPANDQFQELDGPGPVAGGPISGVSGVGKRPRRSPFVEPSILPGSGLSLGVTLFSLGAVVVLPIKSVR